MMSQVKEWFVENESKDQEIHVLCVTCNRETNHRIAASFDKHRYEVDQQELWAVDWKDFYQIVQCLGCETVTFRHLSWFSEACDPEFGEDGTTEYLYPKRGSNTLAAHPLPNVPKPLERLYVEVIDCYNNESLTLCAAGLRALVEGLCADQGVKDGMVTRTKADGQTSLKREKNLEGKINGLHEKGLLTKTSSETLHEHRFLGNEAVHELARPSASELKLAISIIEQTLEHIYEAPQQALALKQATQSRRK
jgi:hypothetical protein